MALDHTKFYEKGKRPSDGGKDVASLRWWLMEGVDCANGITASLDAMKRAHELRRKQLVIASRLYGNLSALGAHSSSYADVVSQHPSFRERISFNVVQSAVDTIHAKTTKNRPRPLFLTSGGTYSEQKRAKLLNRFVDGLFYEARAYEYGETAMRDGCVWADGFVHVFEDRLTGRVRFERVLSEELWVDERDGFYGEPRSLHRCTNIDRQVALEAWPEMREEVLRAEGPSGHDTAGERGASDVIQVRESWHLPSGPSAGDGRHCISVDRCVLFSEVYEKQWFPFARFTWSKRMTGFFGQGLAEQLQNIQVEINKLLQVIQRSFHLGGSFKVLVENSSKVVKEHLNNDVGAIITYTGTPPQYIVPPMVSPEIYSHLRTLKDAAYEQAGVSQLSASSRKPEGLDSGRALRAFSDIESERFIAVGRAYERFYLELARLSIDVSRDIAKRHRGQYKVNARTSWRGGEVIDWGDIRLEESAYVMQMFPTSSLPNDPSGRLQTVQEYIQAGFLSARQGKRLLDFPDLEAVEGMHNAAEDYLTMVLDRIVEHGELVEPEPYDDVKLARKMALEYYERAKTLGVEEERLDLLRQFLSQLDALEEAAMVEEARKQAAIAAAAAPPLPEASVPAPQNTTSPEGVPTNPAAATAAPVSEVIP